MGSGENDEVVGQIQAFLVKEAQRKSPNPRARPRVTFTQEDYSVALESALARRVIVPTGKSNVPPGEWPWGLELH